MKKRVFGIISMACLGFLFAGCATAPTQEQINSAYYGDYPNDYETVVKNFMEVRLKDPASATYKFDAIPTKGWAGGGLSGPVEYGWRICAYINAKNSFGGYVGAKRHFFLIRDSRVVKSEDLELFTEKACQ